MEAAINRIEPAVQNIAELVARIDALFFCMDGPPRAYFEIPMALLAQDINVCRIEYKTLAFSIVGDDEERNETVLCTEFWRYIQNAVLKSAFYLAREECWELGQPTGHVLFWRCRPRVQTFYPELDVDSSGRTREECEDAGVGFTAAAGPKTTRLYGRLEIPGFDLDHAGEACGPIYLTHQR